MAGDAVGTSTNPITARPQIARFRTLRTPPMVGDSPVPSLQTQRSPRRDPPLLTRDSLELLPTAVTLVLLVIALAYDGAFTVSRWGPLAVTTLALLALAPARHLRGPRLVAVAAIWAFAGWTALSAVWSGSPGDAVEGACRSFLYAGLFTLPIATLPDPVAARRLAALAGATLGAFVLVIVAVLSVRGEPLLLAGRLNAPIGYRNGTAALFVMAFWPLICIAAARAVSPVLRGLGYTAASLALGLAFLTQSRGALLGFVVGGAVVLLVGPDRLRRAWLAVVSVGLVALFSSALLGPYDAFLDKVDQSAPITSALHALLAIAVLAFITMVLVSVFDRGLRAPDATRAGLRTAATAALGLGAVVGCVAALAVIGNPATFARDKVREFKAVDAPVSLGSTRLGATGGQRYDLWRVAVDQFEAAPIVGAGEGSYRFAYYRERENDRNLSSPHSLVMEVLAQLGLVGAALLLAFLVAVGVAIARTAASAGENRRWIGAAAAAGAVLIAQSTVDWLWLIPGLTGLAMFTLGLAVALGAGPDVRSATDATRPRPPWLRLAAGGACCAVAAAVALFYLSDYETRKARAAGDHGSAVQQLDAANRAKRLNPWALEPRYLQASALEELGRRAEARAALADALRLEPESFVVPGLLGDLELRAGHERRARVWYRRALSKNPLDTGLQQLAGTPPA
jgi:tetratricopeptide (TPR) repeat protein